MNDPKSRTRTGGPPYFHSRSRLSVGSRLGSPGERVREGRDDMEHLRHVYVPDRCFGVLVPVLDLLLSSP